MICMIATLIVTHATVLVSDREDDRNQTHNVTKSSVNNLLSLSNPRNKLPDYDTHYGLDNVYNERPMIGVISQPLSKTVKGYNSQIPANYIKFIEQSGARAVPILVTKLSDSQIKTLLSNINGVLFTGGDAKLTNDDGSLTEYSRKIKLIVDTVKEYNDKGSYYPIWGTCMGFELISVIEAPYPDVLTKNIFKSENVNNNLTFVSNPAKTRLFRSFPQHLLTAIQKENITFNYHHDGVFPEAYKKYPGLQDYTVIAHSYDLNDVEYVACVEHKRYPIYGVQFHPEKNIHEWSSKIKALHSLHAIETGQYFSNFLIQQARKNFNRFKNEAEETKSRIENHEMLYDDSVGYYFYAFHE